MAPNPTAMFILGDIVHHNKSGNDYLILMTPDRLLIEATKEPAYVYRRFDGDDTRYWVRPQSEMEDGRFTLVRRTPK